MKVYLLIHYYWDNTTILGVFSSQRRASNHIKARENKGFAYGTIEIHEVEVNDKKVAI